MAGARRSWDGWILAATALVVAQPARAQSPAVRFDLPAGDLATALEQAAQKAGVGLLFDRTRIATRRAPALHARLTADQAFASLLWESGLTVRQIGPGSYVLVIPDTLPVAPPAPAIPDILVIGRRTQNTDIQRRADDIQPYRVVTSKRIADAQAGSPEDLLRTQLAANELGASTTQLGTSQGGSVRSQIDLRGLGTAQTLVLVDGRRMPGIPGVNEFFQPDVNGIPLSAIERVETLGGTAGGIYGPGATGGVVNIVLKQEYPHVWIEGQGGLDDSGDGAQYRLTGGFSLSANGDRTRINVLASHTVDRGLVFGDRRFPALAHDYRISRPNEGLGTLLLGSSINIISQGAGHPSLVLIPAFGGQSLGSEIAHYPVNAGGAGGDEAALLLAGAGSFDTKLSDDGNGARQSLLTPFTATSLIASVHQDIGDHIEAFGNVLLLSDRGRATVPVTSELFYTLARGQAGNPFDNDIAIAVPTPGLSTSAETRTDTSRVTLGLIGHVGGGWSVEADIAAGRAAIRQTVLPDHLSLDLVDVFSPGTQLQQAIATIAAAPRQTTALTNRLHDASVRIAGPVAALPGGPATLTLSGEYRDERTPGARDTNPDGSLVAPQEMPHEQEVLSAFGEARMPLVSATSPLLPIRSLELQLAVRGDRYRITEPDQYDYISGDPSAPLEARHTTFAFTAGAKARPIAGLLLRASYATGFLPPTPGQILPLVQKETGYFMDPKRPQLPDFANFPTFIGTRGGQPSLSPELARTLALGVVFEPHFVNGLRLSVDYTLIRKAHEIVSFLNTDLSPYQFFVTHEADFPGRVTRAPLTAADIAQGDTGGAITAIDATSINAGRSTLQAIDFDLDYTRSFAFGLVHLYTNATWVPSFRRRGDPHRDYREYAGQYDGPLHWKGNAGLEWSRGRLSTVLTAQYVGSYAVTVAESSSVIDGNVDSRITQQGGATIAPQVYFDAGVGYRLRAGGHIIQWRFGIKNLLGTSPPLFVPLVDYLTEQGDYSPGYSTYADPRGRRFVLTAGFDL